MKILIITQDEPFYLSESLKKLIGLLPNKHTIAGCVVSTASPFGKQESFFQKAIKTFNIFGLKFFCYYAIKFILAKLKRRRSLNSILKKNDIKKIILEDLIDGVASDLKKKIHIKNYSNFIPLIGKLVVGEKKPYEYLIKSIENFISQEELLDLMKENNFKKCKYRKLSGGIVSIHSGWKF